MQNDFVMIPVPVEIVNEVYSFIGKRGGEVVSFQSRSVTPSRSSSQKNQNISQKRKTGRRESRNNQTRNQDDSLNLSNGNYSGNKDSEWNKHLLRKVLNESPGEVRTFLKTLADNPGQNVSISKIASKNNWTPEKIAEAVGRFSERCKTRYSVNRLPFIKRSEGKTVRYFMPKNIAQQIQHL